MNHILVVGQQFCIKVENQGPALAALKDALNERPWIAVTGYRHKDYPFPFLAESADILRAETLMDVLEIRGWLVLGIIDGAITCIGTRDNEKVDDDLVEYAFWSVLAPYIEPGYLECKTFENDDHWRWAFDGTLCHFMEPSITWPEI